MLDNPPACLRALLLAMTRNEATLGAHHGKSAQRTLYTGVTSDLIKRTWQHREGVIGGFTKRYGCKLVVWYELLSTMHDAIGREKQIKGGSRKAKLALTESVNADWSDLYAAIAQP